MRKTKIICTMGPSTDKGDVMEQLVREGRNMTDLLQHFLIQRDRRSDLDASRMVRFLWKKDRFLHLQIKILKELMSA